MHTLVRKSFFLDPRTLWAASAHSLPVALERLGVVLLPDRAARRHEAELAVAIADATALATGGGEATELAVLHHGLA